MKDKIFGDAGKEIIIEEFLEGEEVSLFSLVDSSGYIYENLYEGLYDYKIFPLTDGIWDDEDLEYEDLNWVKEERIKVAPPSLDDILDKIGEVGIDKLSDSEKNILNNYSKTKK